MDESWFYEREGESAGPVSARAVRRAIERGEVDAQTLIWREGMDDWQPAESVDVFRASLALPQPAPPVVDVPPSPPSSQPVVVPAPPDPVNAITPAETHARHNEVTYAVPAAAAAGPFLAFLGRLKWLRDVVANGLFGWFLNRPRKSQETPPPPAGSHASASTGPVAMVQQVNVVVTQPEAGGGDAGRHSWLRATLTSLFSQWLISKYVVLAITVTITVVVIYHQRPRPPKVPVATATGQVRIDANPWGEVQWIKGPRGRKVKLDGGRSTPLITTLPEGSYAAHVTYPHSSTSKECTFQVQAGQVATCWLNLAPVSAKAYFERIGW